MIIPTDLSDGESTESNGHIVLAGDEVIRVAVDAADVETVRAALARTGVVATEVPTPTGLAFEMTLPASTVEFIEAECARARVRALLAVCKAG